MGVKNLPHIVSRLQEHGRSGGTPVALVRWGTTARQQTVTGTLDTIVDIVQQAGIKAPAIIVIGEVVKLRNTLKWFENRPLLGKRVVVTRARAQASDLVEKLSNLGAQCIEAPTIETVPPQDPAPLGQAIGSLKRYHWLVFTSVNGVNAFFERLYSEGLDSRSLGHTRVAAIGPATARRLLQYGIRTDIIPETYQAESVIDAFASLHLQGKQILLPRAREARSVLPRELDRMGAVVTEVVAYETRAVADHARQIQEDVQNGAIDMITFTSSSTVRNFIHLLSSNSPARMLANVRIACIGPITAETARSHGLNVDLTADTFTIDGLCDAIVAYYSRSRTDS
jgi:uroporphyrinogen III methyltransferase/synthase